MPHPVPREHPRLFGSLERLQNLQKDRPEPYGRMAAAARDPQAHVHERIFSMALVAAIEADRELGRAAVELVLKTIGGPIRQGHVPFGTDLAQCAVTYDLCHEAWTDAERKQFFDYFGKTVDANVDSEPHVFHNGWYSYKHWGYGLAAYAAYHEFDRAPGILADLDRDYRRRAAPALEFSGDGGGFGEGYYTNYWSYPWIFFCEAARHCEGIDYYELAPGFFRHRALASMFESYPGIVEHGSRRQVPMGDGGGRFYHIYRDAILSARRILVNRFRKDPEHQAVHAFNELTPAASDPANAYMDFLWRDPSVEAADLARFKLSHHSSAAGYIYARSSWDEDATYFFMHCGKRFTAHQHLDNGHFVIYRHNELAGDGGHYDGFGTLHDINYHLRTIAHSTILVHDPDECWPFIRAGEWTVGDGGQAHDWPHHNGAAADVHDWQKQAGLFEIAAITAYSDPGPFMYAAGDATRSYSKLKMECFTRQVVFIRPGTFVILDRVVSTKPEFRKTWLLQAMQIPEERDGRLVITNGDGRLFVQTLLPKKADVKVVAGDEQYIVSGRTYLPDHRIEPAPKARIEVSPAEPAAEDLFLHVLTAADADAEKVPSAKVSRKGETLTVKVGNAEVKFTIGVMTGQIRIGEKLYQLNQ